MDARRPFLIGFGSAVVNVVVPLVMVLRQLIIAIVEIIEKSLRYIFRAFELQNAEVNKKAVEETDEMTHAFKNRQQQTARSRNELESDRFNGLTDDDRQILIKYKLLEDRLVETIEQANIASRLLLLQFSEDDAVDAARNCPSVESSIAYLNRECEACKSRYPMSQMIYMLNCTHSCCRSCAKSFFSMQILHHDVTDCLCPYCKKPELNGEDMSAYEVKDYFTNLSIILENILNPNVHGIFQRKLNAFLNKHEDEEEEEEEEQSTSRDLQEEPLKQQILSQPKLILQMETLQQSTSTSVKILNQPKNPSEFEHMEHKALVLLQDGKVNEFAQAEMVVTLMSLQYGERESIDASRNCSTLDNAITYLSQKCGSCDHIFCMNEMISMLNCEHNICHDCTKKHFTEQITDHDIPDCTCPICELPNFDDSSEDDISTYITNLDVVLNELLDADVHDQFQLKLRDFTLKKDPSYENEPQGLSEALQRQARQFVQEGQVENYLQSELAIRLIQAEYTVELALEAVKHCTTLDGAIAFLNQDCDICADKFKMSEMVSMLSCEHRCCITCAKNYFTEQINERTILDCNCPFCNVPNLNDEELSNNYFSNLDIMLNTILEPPVYEVFQNKLRDWTLTKNPNFKWCPHCTSGFIAEQRQQQGTCPNCRAITCLQCRKPWEDQHAGITCERFTEWKEANDPGHQAVALESHLARNGIDCPKCKHRFFLSRGGCMHFTCSQCKHEFCQGCAKPFSNKCTDCTSGGLHAHHPRNCLYYLRDRDPSEVQMLLRKFNVPFNTERPADSPNIRTCLTVLQLQRSSGTIDAYCADAVLPGHAGLCRSHYIEYLAVLIKANRIDPIDVFDLTFITCEMERRGIPVPKHDKATTTPEEYKDNCAKIVKKQIPLE